MAGSDLLFTKITVDRAPDPILWIRPDGRIVYANDAACRVFGYPREEFLQREITGLDPDSPGEALSRRLREQAGPGSRTFESEVRAADGTRIPVEVSANHILHGGTELDVCTVRDIRDRRQTERRLRESEERFREMAELLPEAIFEADLGLNITYANRRASDLFGFTEEEIQRGVNGLQGIAPEDRPRAVALLERRRTGEEPGVVEYNALRKDGSVFPILFHAGSLVRDGRLVGLRGIIVDLTEKRRAEAEVRTAGERVQNFIEASPMGILTYHLESDGRLVLIGANPASGRLLGVDAGQLVGKTIEEAFPGLVGTEVPERYRIAAAEGVSWRTDQIVYDDGTVRGAFEVVAFRTAPHEVGVMFVEVTERMRAQEERARSEERLRLATRSGRVGVWEYEPATDTLEWDDLMYQIHGVDPARAPDGIGRWVERVHPEDFPAAQASFLASWEPGAAPFDTEFRIVRERDGQVRHIRGMAGVVRDEAGRVIRAIGVNWDITESKRALEALLESESRFRSVIEQSNDAIYIILQNRFDLVNRKFCEITGVTPEEATGPGFSFWSLVAPESVPLIEERRDRRARGEEVPGVYDFVILAKDGRRVTVEASVTEIDYRGQKAVMGLLRDVTQQTKLEDQLRQSQKMESIGRLSGGVAHDLNNLLSPIIGYGEMLLEDFGKADRRRESAEEIVKAAHRARDLVRQLLAFSRKQTLEFRAVDLNRLVAEFQKLLRRAIREDIHIESVLSPSIKTIQADLGQLEQVIMNLAVNAQDAMPEGGRLTIETGLQELDAAFASTHPGVTPGEYVLLAVSDSGVGMDAQTAGKVFEPFFTTKEKGTGLGLSTVYGIVKQHGGSIWVYTEPRAGTTFKCYFPVRGGASPEKERHPDSGGRGPGGSETVMVVEDEPSVRSLAETVLRRQGYTVLAAKDGKEALSILQARGGKLDLVLTDVVLPGMNGRALVEEILGRFPQVRTLFMSGYTDEVITRHGVLEEGIAFLQKPFTVRQLTAKVREVLGGE